MTESTLTVQPYGTWHSTVTPEVASRSGRRFMGVAFDRPTPGEGSDPHDSGAPTLWWAMANPQREGASTVFCREPDGTIHTVGDSTIRPQNRIHEYGGGAFGVDHTALYWTDQSTQMLMGTATRHANSDELNELDDFNIAQAYTIGAGPSRTSSWRHGNVAIDPDGQFVIFERERHTDKHGHALTEAVHDLVVAPSVATSESREQGQHHKWLSFGFSSRQLKLLSETQPIELLGPDDIGGGDFIAEPTISPDGNYLAWLRWDHPDMPWDSAELWTGALERTDDGLATLTNARRIAGGWAGGDAAGLDRAVSISLPVWDHHNRLWWCSDLNGWWHLYRGETTGLLPDGHGDRLPPAVPLRGANNESDAEPASDSASANAFGEEVGEPRWVSRGSRYGFTASGHIVAVCSYRGFDEVWVINPDTHERHRLVANEISTVDQLVVSGQQVAIIGGGFTQPTSLLLLELDDDAQLQGKPIDVVRDVVPSAVPVDAASVSVPEPYVVPTANGDVTHAMVFLPQNATHVAPDGELPPLLIRIHGGPTASARTDLSPSVQFWTSRGIAVAEVNYRGSSGFGRAYRDQLNNAWGIADVEDCIAVAEHLGSIGLIDPKRCVIRGGSSGGFTTLAVLCMQERWGKSGVFAAGTSLYGVTDLAALAADTHKFESRYLDGLIGPPEDTDTYTQRSPLTHVDALASPVLLLAGEDDKVVPPSQARMLINKLNEHDVAHIAVFYPGEGHGFQRPATIEDALLTELSFYGKVLGFTPAGDVPTVNFE